MEPENQIFAATAPSGTARAVSWPDPASNAHWRGKTTEDHSAQRFNAPMASLKPTPISLNL
jgi:hypothetical protein